MFNSRWNSYNEYVLDYLELLWSYYCYCGKSIPATYYSLDLPNSVFDQTQLDAGPYEIAGELSGLRWKKILLVQVFQPETINLNFSSNEQGFGKLDQQSSIWLPSAYNINPQVHDFVIFDNIEDRDNQFIAKSPLFEVRNIEKASNTEKTFWKASLKVSHFEKEVVDKQLSGTYTFFDSEKQIYRTDDTINILNAVNKNRLCTNSVNVSYDNLCGMFVKKDLI